MDGVYAYHLAVTLDDAWQEVNQIVRGADLLEVTPLHLYVNRLLGVNDAEYLHLPLVKTSAGKKLSKQTGAQALDVAQAPGLLLEALQFLGQDPDPTLRDASCTEILAAAVARWDRNSIAADRI